MFWLDVVWGFLLRTFSLVCSLISTEIGCSPGDCDQHTVDLDALIVISNPCEKTHLVFMTPDTLQRPSGKEVE